MKVRGRWLAFAALSVLAGCDRAAPEQQAPVATPPAEAASTPAEASVTPEPQPTPEPSPSPTSSPTPTEARYAPREDCDKAAGWKAFRGRLATAVTARDAGALAALADPNIRLDYGGGSGADELKKRLADPKAGLWQELDRILPLGCSIEGGLAAMPWYFWNVPDDGDPYTTMLATGPDVPLRATPSATGETRATLDWAMVSIASESFDPKARFTRVKLMASGQKGYVETAKLRSVISYRLIAEPHDGGWKITALISGD